MIKTILEILAGIFKFLTNKQLLDAGKAQNELEAKNEAEKDIAIAEAIRNSDNVDYSFLLSPEDRAKLKK